MKRRLFLASLGLIAARPGWGEGMPYPAADPAYRMTFPRDHGAHPAFRTEWWYVTGWLHTARGDALGFQVTFFRLRPRYAFDGPTDAPAVNPSSFAPRQLLLAHAALADAKLGRLRHDQRAARAVLGTAGAAEDTTRAWIDGWRLDLVGNTYTTRIEARDFGLTLAFAAERAPLLQGENGYSRKGRGEGEASHYYSRPGLAARGSIERGRGLEEVRGRAWLDHEWSSAYLAQGADGWDWIGINLEDGGALMAFRMRGRSGEVLYAGGTWVRADGRRETFEPAQVEFAVLRKWRSPRTGTEYPVALRVRVRDAVWRIEPMLDDQELDSRASTGTIYWEGAVRVFLDQPGTTGVRPAGHGYLELTGYWRPLRL